MCSIKSGERDKEHSTELHSAFDRRSRRGSGLEIYPRLTGLGIPILPDGTMRVIRTGR